MYNMLYHRWARNIDRSQVQAKPIAYQDMGINRGGAGECSVPATPLQPWDCCAVPALMHKSSLVVYT